eukprot:TRINITY_DN15094_c0_g1_i1.p1 TRINITY_DN15094_c0_g1~~TRINITY_DN15094_c0_g1_i1.p1  ORF type:complete len:249 (+),score=-23.10 TRINITY_DN15094_c0_g1_i1:492-1238(+)
MKHKTAQAALEQVTDLITIFSQKHLQVAFSHIPMQNYGNLYIWNTLVRKSKCSNCKCSNSHTIDILHWKHECPPRFQKTPTTRAHTSIIKCRQEGSRSSKIMATSFFYTLIIFAQTLYQGPRAQKQSSSRRISVSSLHALIVSPRTLPSPLFCSLARSRSRRNIPLITNLIPLIVLALRPSNFQNVSSDILHQDGGLVSIVPFVSICFHFMMQGFSFGYCLHRLKLLVAVLEIFIICYAISGLSLIHI